MKIQWIDKTKTVPMIGLMRTGATYDIPDGIGKSLIKQNQAKIIMEETKTIKSKRKGDG